MVKRGRPTDYTDNLAETICAGIVGGDSIRTVCADGGMPSVTTVYRWLSENEKFREQYARARSGRADARFERIDDVVEDMREGKIDAQQARVEIDAIKWQCGKEAGKYDDKMRHELSGPDGGPIQLTDTERDQRILSILDRGRARGTGQAPVDEDMGASAGSADPGAGESG